MEEFLFAIQQEWAIRALIASSLVGVMCGVLGCFIVLRNMALIGDALSHAILPGVVVAFVLIGHNSLGFFAGAVIAGLVTAIGITWIQQNVKTKNDAAIGIVFTAMFAIGVMGISEISRKPGVHLDLHDFLFGNILGVSDEDLYITAATTLYVLLSVIVFYRYLFITTFQSVIAATMGISTSMVHYFLMLLLSFAVVASLQTVGVILVVAMLVTPAATALLISDKLSTVVFIAALIGLLSAIFGFFLAVSLETTPGPAMTITATLIYLFAVFFSPKKGLVFRYFRSKKLKIKIQLEDTMKQASRLQEKGLLTFDNLSERLGFNKATLKRHIATLSSKGFFTKKAGELALTQNGTAESNRLVRAHRLWETYMVQEMGMTEDQIHEEAEKYEHLLTDELLDDVDSELGFPTMDPHGSPIPSKERGFNISPLINLKLLQEAKIASQQLNEHVSSQLWRYGLTPGTVFSIAEKTTRQVGLLIENKEVRIPSNLAKKININSLE